MYKRQRYIGSSIGRIFYLLDKAERFEMDKRSGRYNVFVVNDLRGQAAAVENARRQALACLLYTSDDRCCKPQSAHGGARDDAAGPLQSRHL